MAIVANAAGEQLILQIGNGATPEVFTAVCTINTTRSLDLIGNATSQELADCVTPSNPATTVRQIKSTDLKFTGAGITDAPSFNTTLLPWWQAGTAKNCKVVQNRTGANGGFTFSLPMVVTALNTGGPRGDQQSFTGTFEAAGAITYAQNP